MDARRRYHATISGAPGARARRTIKLGLVELLGQAGALAVRRRRLADARRLRSHTDIDGVQGHHVP